MPKNCVPLSDTVTGQKESNLYDVPKTCMKIWSSKYDIITGTPERRCSSRTFRYGYLVTT